MGKKVARVSDISFHESDGALHGATHHVHESHLTSGTLHASSCTKTSANLPIETGDMNAVCALLFLLVVVVLAQACPKEEWTNFKKRYGKTYYDPIEERARCATYVKTKREVDEFNGDPNNVKKKELDSSADWFPSEDCLRGCLDPKKRPAPFDPEEELHRPRQRRIVGGKRLSAEDYPEYISTADLEYWLAFKAEYGKDYGVIEEEIARMMRVLRYPIVVDRYGRWKFHDFLDDFEPEIGCRLGIGDSRCRRLPGLPATKHSARFSRRHFADSRSEQLD